jgi:hypothetical protein
VDFQSNLGKEFHGGKIRPFLHGQLSDNLELSDNLAIPFSLPFEENPPALNTEFPTFAFFQKNISP